MNRDTYKVIKRRFVRARQRLLRDQGLQDPLTEREYERAKHERDRAYGSNRSSGRQSNH
jgi:hypothetical protein